MTTDYATATEVINAMERDRLRRSALEQLYAALKANIAAQDNKTWRAVLAAMKAVAATDNDNK